MDFFSHQDKARRNTGLLVFLYLSSIALLVGAICLLFVLFLPDLVLSSGSDPRQVAPFSGLWWARVWQDAKLGTIFGIAIMVTSFILLASLFKMSQLSHGGGAMIASSLGGRRLNPAAKDPKEKQLQNIVEEMALAAGIAVPEVYVMDQEAGINAFAAGTALNQAVIGVTRGCMEQLTRDELQGVIAHEFSHIVNGDMKLNVRLMGVLFGILCIQQFGYIVLRSSRGHRRGKNSGGAIALGFGLFALGLIGYFFGNIIKAAVSRQREFLADASAVQYTRNPSGIAGALKKIGGFGSKLNSERATELSHMFFATGVFGLSARAFSTHPPLAVRIKRIDTSFRAEGLASKSDMPKARTEDQAALAGFASSQAEPRASELVKQVGTSTPEGIAAAHDFLGSIQGPLFEAIHEPEAAQFVVYAILLGEKPTHRAKQVHAVRSVLGTAASERVSSYHSYLSQLGTKARLPILDLCIPALRQVQGAELQQFLSMTKKIVLADEKYELFEYSLLAVLSFNLLSRPASKNQAQLRLSKPEALAIVLAALSHVGHENQTARQEAFARGMAALNPSFEASMPTWNIAQFDSALRRLDQLSFQQKKVFIEACAIVVAHDGRVSAEELEVLRAISETLSCPIPAFY